MPVPVAVDTKVIRGSMVEFIVRAPTASSKRVDFIVRSEPEVGRLEGPVPVDGDNHGSRFGYHCPADSEIDLVVVEIAARLPGGGVSKAVPDADFLLRMPWPFSKRSRKWCDLKKLLWGIPRGIRELS